MLQRVVNFLDATVGPTNFHPTDHKTGVNLNMTQSFDREVHERYFEDYEPGSVHEYGEIEVEAGDIIDFANRFDPQFFHVDPIAAEQGPFQGLIASGWHTAGMMMSLFVDHYLSHVASLGASGVDELRWPRPVRPGDTLRLRATVIDAVASKSKPDRGVVRTRAELINQNGELVFSAVVPNILLRRHTGSDLSTDD